MILKNLEVMNHSRQIGIRADVVIRRNGKYYSIFAQKTYGFTPKDSYYYKLKCFRDMVTMFIEEASRIDELYVIDGNPEVEVPVIGKMTKYKEVTF